MKERTPNIVMPRKAVMIVEARSAGIRNSSSGINGSFARSSIMRNARKRMALPAKTPMTSTEVHG